MAVYCTYPHRPSLPSLSLCTTRRGIDSFYPLPCWVHNGAGCLVVLTWSYEELRAGIHSSISPNRACRSITPYVRCLLSSRVHLSLFYLPLGTAALGFMASRPCFFPVPAFPFLWIPLVGDALTWFMYALMVLCLSLRSLVTTPTC